MRLERVGEVLRPVRIVNISILRARRAVSLDIVCLVVRSADRKRNLIRIRRNDVRIRARSGGRPRDLFRHAVNDGVVRAVIDLVRTARDAELRGIDLAFRNLALTPNGARGHDSVRRRFARDSLTVEDIARSIDEFVVVLIGTLKFDAAVGNAMRTRVLRFRAGVGVAVACPILPLDIRIVKKICRRITSDGIRKRQHIVCRRRNISSALDIHITVINLVDARRRVQRRRNLALGDVALEVQGIDSARIKLIVFLVARRARKLHQGTVDINGLVISDIRTFRRGGCPCLTEGDGIVVGEIDRRIVAVHKAIRAQGNITRLDSVGKLR